MLVPRNTSKTSSLDAGVGPSLRREETVLVALLLASAGGYLDAFAAFYPGNQIGALRRSGIFTGLCVAFGAGAAVGAFLTKQIPYLALGAPIVVLLMVLLLCETERGWTRK